MNIRFGARLSILPKEVGFNKADWQSRYNKTLRAETQKTLEHPLVQTVMRNTSGAITIDIEPTYDPPQAGGDIPSDIYFNLVATSPAKGKNVPNQTSFPVGEGTTAELNNITSGTMNNLFRFLTHITQMDQAIKKKEQAVKARKLAELNHFARFMA